MKKKGQLQVQETIMVVFILVVIIILGLVLFYRFTSVGLEQEYRDNQITRFNAMMATVPEIGEVKCSMYGEPDNCIDVYKVIIMNTLKERDPNYRNYLVERYGFMEMKIQIVYPFTSDVECNTGQIKDCGIWEIYSNVPPNSKYPVKKSTPVSIYLPHLDTYGIGILNISKYDLE